VTVSGQVHAPADLNSEKEFSVPNEDEKFLSEKGINPDTPFRNSHFTDWVIRVMVDL
jgi:hypothetical protein